MKPKLIWPVRVGLVALALFLSVRTATSHLQGNIGLVRLLGMIKEESDPAASSLTELESMFRESLASRYEPPSAHRGLGFVYWHQGRDGLALDQWQHTDYTASDYVSFGEQTRSISESLRWYRLAERVDPRNSALWLRVGQICQTDPSVGDICDRFLAYNGYNQLVDPSFAFGREAWRFNRREGASYAITACPEASDKQCAMVQIHAVTSPYGTSWRQCLTLEAGKRYRFSAWVKADTEGQWMPIYLQGDRDGKPYGIKMGGSYVGAQDWTYLEEDYVVPKFDGDRACFYPVRLLGTGRAWFHSAELRSMGQVRSDR